MFFAVIYEVYVKYRATVLALGSTFSDKKCLRIWSVSQRGGFLGLGSLLRHVQLSINMEIAVMSRKARILICKALYKHD